MPRSLRRIRIWLLLLAQCSSASTKSHITFFIDLSKVLIDPLKQWLLVTVLVTECLMMVSISFFFRLPLPHHHLHYSVATCFLNWCCSLLSSMLNTSHHDHSIHLMMFEKLNPLFILSFSSEYYHVRSTRWTWLLLCNDDCTHGYCYTISEIPQWCGEINVFCPKSPSGINVH